jgi:hypothetical protein
MRTLRRFLSRLANLATRRQDDERLQEEIAEHIALQTAENVRAGLSPAEARRQAVLFAPRMATYSLGVLGVIAAMLCITGIFGKAAYSVSTRKREFGIRMFATDNALR